MFFDEKANQGVSEETQKQLRDMSVSYTFMLQKYMKEEYKRRQAL